MAYFDAVAWIAANDTTQAQIATGVYPPRMPKLQANLPALNGLTAWWKLSVIFHGQNNPSNNYRDFDPSAILTSAQITQLTNVSETGSVGYSDDINVPMPSGSQDTVVGGAWTPVAANTPWNIYQDPDWQAALNRGFFGGDAVLSLEILDSGSNVVGPEQDYKFRIAGENPNPTACEAYIQSQYNGSLPVSQPQRWTSVTFTPGSTPPTVPGYWFAYAIAKEETATDGGRNFYNNFMDNGGKLMGKSQAWPGHEGRPDWNNDDVSGNLQYGTGGYGLFQLTYEGAHGKQQAESNFIMPRDWIWNWTTNVQKFLSKMQEKLQQAQSSVNSTRSSFGGGFSDPSPLTVVKDGVTFNFWESTVITRNNGGKGWNAKRANKPTIWGTYVPSGSTGYLYYVAYKGISNHP